MLDDPGVPKDAKLIMIGTCRDSVREDAKIVEDIEITADKMGIRDRIQIMKN